MRITQITPPSFDPELLRAREEALALIEKDPILYNGTKLICQEVRDGQVLIYQADYALRLALEKTQSSSGLGSLWCGALLQNPLGQVMLARRAPGLPVEPGRWFASSAGGIDPSETPEKAAGRELLEETGLQVDLEWAGALVGRYPYGVGMIYRGLVSENIQPRLDPQELVEWGWFEPDSLPNPAADLLELLVELTTN